MERGEDPKAVGEPLRLAQPALELAKKVGSDATDVKAARQDNKFRTMGLLPGFSAANQEINNSARQVSPLPPPLPFAHRVRACFESQGDLVSCDALFLDETVCSILSRTETAR